MIHADGLASVFYAGSISGDLISTGKDEASVLILSERIMRVLRRLNPIVGRFFQQGSRWGMGLFRP